MLKDMTIKEFIYETASDSPAPGGGSIAALSAASAAALIEMVANLTIGKKGYEEVEEEMKELKGVAAEYKEKFINYIDEDSDSFNKIMDAFKMPKNTEEEKKARTKVIQEGFKGAATVPLNVAKDAFELLALAEKVIEKGNQNAVTDGAVAAMSARTAVHSALYNVKINLGSIKDEEFVNTTKKKIEELESNVNKIEEEILNKVEL
ncbi:cyclodeaminase/cyclohydrolase family protein [Clostridium cochlearium]|jgi:formiminotetrahydrofolate cyclodeaminase|uniref:Cyclodeaminase/cyclohydrolase family protein n=1 Tax=Clostridium cochlearium TaxID=1494 RepID=A0A240ATP3_CLOCO|nr:cyclodeaminase/cyclohydrolase family protein [Clostridium cochlearium]MBE6064798.1 cyclodeaminase/cyclohydrolase family protein [Clostridium cochlearium]MBU5268256.1 cyclodeaminase/cyclohydrolase family protein [Clostridium cochlearium]MCG4571814.1 cyclodeaminase/cyclohydrolase family protein [Clostridium cochlearium]MDU1443517.1 cyclodeaminase/cyclohydrolase family protein [Clostridium cochlearium]NMA57267.1 cyclodeaminase/cyclohydrolase family protein [Clostridium cochlearium]